MARTICVVSGKGGVGKTTSAVNVAHALSRHKTTLLVDANLSTPNVNIQLGWPILKKSLTQVLAENRPAHDAIYMHESGLKVLPAMTSVRELKRLQYEKLKHLVMELHRHAEIIVVDCAAGLGRETLAAMEACDEVLIITNPEMTAVLDAQKAVQVAHELGKPVLGTVLTKVGSSRHEMSATEVERMLDIPVIAIVPFDDHVRKAVSKQRPVTHSYPFSKAGKSYHALAARLLGPKYVENMEKRDSLYRYILKRLGLS